MAKLQSTAAMIALHPKRKEIERDLVGCLARQFTWKDVGAKWDFLPGPLATYAKKMLAAKEKNGKSIRWLTESAADTTADEWREMGRSLWMEASEAVEKCQEAGDYKCLAELIRVQIEAFKIVGVSLGVSIDSPLLDKGETSFTMNQVFVGAPDKKLDPMSDGTYPPIRGFIDGRREESLTGGGGK